MMVANNPVFAIWTAKPASLMLSGCSSRNTNIMLVPGTFMDVVVPYVRHCDWVELPIFCAVNHCPFTGAPADNCPVAAPTVPTAWFIDTLRTRSPSPVTNDKSAGQWNDLGLEINAPITETAVRIICIPLL